MTTDAALTRDRAVLRNLLDHFGTTTPDAPFVHFYQGEVWTYGEMLEKTRRRAAFLAGQGVGQGDHVLTFMGNGPELLLSWFAINYLGAVYVPMNTALLGRLLEYMLGDADAPVLIARPDLVVRLKGLNPGAVRTVLLAGPGEAADVGLPTRRLSDPDTYDLAAITPARPIEPWDTQAIMYTSGTTGNAKGVLSSYTQLYTMGPDAFDCVTDDETCMICGPIFHCGSTLYVYTMLARGGAIGMMSEFKTDQFWDAVRETGSTFALLLGVMASFLLKAPATPHDRDHPLNKVFIVPFGEHAPAFAERFGADLYTVYNMTEISSPLHAGPGISDKGLAGLPRPWMELRVVDENDIELPRGQVGELVIRSSRPWALMKGYYKNPAATAMAMRNGWFHTGDSFRQDAEGRFFFVDRLKDVIRRRGENISSFALEGEVLAHPDVRECAAVAVPSEDSEDEVLIVVTPVEGCEIDAPVLHADLAARLPRFMVPRYIRVLDDLPKTASGKVQKHVMRTEGMTADTWEAQNTRR